MLLEWKDQVLFWDNQVCQPLLLAGLEDLISLLPAAVTIIVVLSLVLKAWTGSKAIQRRMEALEKAAQELSLPFSRTVAYEQIEQLVQYPVMQRGSKSEFTNAIVAETEQLRLMLLDYKYVSGSGKNQSTHRLTVAWVSSQQLNLPSFNIYPETWMHRIGDLITKKDIDFDEDPEFSNKFVLTGADQAGVREFLNAKRRQVVMGLNLPNLEVLRHGFVLYYAGKLIDPSELKSLMNQAFSLYQAFAPEQESA